MPNRRDEQEVDAEREKLITWHIARIRKAQERFGDELCDSGVQAITEDLRCRSTEDLLQQRDLSERLSADVRTRNAQIEHIADGAVLAAR